MTSPCNCCRTPQGHMSITLSPRSRTSTVARGLDAGEGDGCVDQVTNRGIRGVHCKAGAANVNVPRTAVHVCMAPTNRPGQLVCSHWVGSVPSAATGSQAALHCYNSKCSCVWGSASETISLAGDRPGGLRVRKRKFIRLSPSLHDSALARDAMRAS